ncbi:hypothetical protein VTP01DRAFT_10399, partial [Rhizomucor pusillus]|uniref:uncharacterized protein n=1 Tax=Rhizomucor pusillus TaxID=4840 RepID=UPI0037430C66
MLQRARLVRQIFCSRSCTIAVRSYGSRSKAGTFDKKTRKTMEEIKDLEYRLEASKKREETLSRLAELSERDAEAVYAELTAPPPPRLAKVGPDYLERLRVKFLDTRPLQLDDPKSVKALPAKTATEQDASATDNWQQDALQIIEKSPKTL